MQKRTKTIALLLIALLVCTVFAACNHVHQYEEKWSFNPEYHFHKATCGHDVSSNQEKHIFDDGVPDGLGNVTFTCEKCHYQRSEKASEIPHEHQIEPVPEKQADCGHDGNDAYFRCTFCNAAFSDQAGEHEIELSSVIRPATGQHSYPQTWTVEKKATLDEKGTEFRICTVCQNKESRETDKLTVKKIEVTTAPSRTAYEAGETFDKSGMVVTATLSDDSKLAVTDYTVDKTTLSVGDTFVTVTFRGATVQVAISVRAAATSVSEAKKAAAATELTVKGLYVGVADEGPNGNKEILLKDEQTDDVVAVRGVPYGIFPDVGYEYGDKVVLSVTVSKVDGTNANNPSKIYLAFAESNGEIDSTIMSKGNKVTYSLAEVKEVASQTDFASVFAVGKLQPYTYVRITGDIWLGTYTGSDNVKVFYVHMNSSATKAANIKPDGTRAVSMRENVNAQNLGADWKKLFFETEPSGLPGVKFSGSIVALYTGANGAYFQLTVLSSDMVTKRDAVTAEDALTEVAYAYYNQGKQIQYDQYNTRRHINPSPEDATDDNILYLDCSTYVNAVYYETFGVNVLPYTTTAKPPKTGNYNNYARDNPSAKDVAGYWENADYATEAKQTELLTKVYGMLKTGDVLVYRHGASSGSSGHVYVYVGGDTFLHCTGSSYSANTTNPLKAVDQATSYEKNYGAIQTINSNAIFKDKTSSRYLFKNTSSDKVYSFALLRPLNRGLTVTGKTQLRMASSGVAVEKTVDAGLHNAIAKGGEATYTFKVENTTSASVKNLVLTDSVGSGATYVSGSITGGGTAEGGNLSWKFDLSANETKTFTYKVKVDAAVKEKVIESDGAKLNGMALNSVVNTISGFTASQKTKLVNKADEYISSSKTFSNPILMVKTLYSEALGIDLFTYTSVSGVLSDLISTTNNTFRSDTAVSQMLLPDGYGGLGIQSGFATDNDRFRMVRERYLEVGDIILAEYNSSNNTVAYVYLGSGRMIGVYSGTNGKVSIGVTISSDEYKNILVTLLSYNRYAVLRPSMTK